MGVKRSINFLNEQYDDVFSTKTEFIKTNDESNKRHKIQPLMASNNIGLLSPPVTPENHQKTLNIQQSTLKSASKNLSSNLLNHSDVHEKIQLSNKYNINHNNNNIKKKTSPYSDAKNLFLRSSKPYSNGCYVLSGREKEAKILTDHITNTLKTMKSDSIYVSGPPGTGKSAQINATINSLFSNSSINDSNNDIYSIKIDDNIKRKIRVVKFNCMSISNPTDLFKELYYKLSGNKYISSDGSSQLFKILTKRKSSDCDMTILVLDEMDNIVNKSQQSLFELFTYASNLIESDEKPNLLLIGIANALDLTDRFLPRLRANCISPKLVQFLPYTADQIKSVIFTKLFTLLSDNKENQPQEVIKSTLPPIVHPAAIQFCAKKSAVTTGDLRKAFDVMFKSIDLFEESLLKTHTVEELNAIPINKLPKLMISQVVKVCSSSFNSNFELKLNPLNLQKKMILAFLFKFEEKVEIEYSKIIKSKITTRGKETISINTFFEYYIEKCKYFNGIITQLKRAEFLEIIGSLDVHGLVTLSMVNTSSSTKTLLANNGVTLNFDNFKVTSTIPKMEFFKIVNDNTILKRIFYSNY